MDSILIVNNHIEIAKQERDCLAQAFPDVEFYAFSDPILASGHVYNNPVSCVLADIEMRPINGFAYMRLLHKYDAHLPYFLVGTSEDQRADVMRSEADGFLLREEILSGAAVEILKNYRKEAEFF